MFTGIVEEQGEILRAADANGLRAFTVRARKVIEGVQIGDSIAVQGVCLTVTEFTADTFHVEAVPETLARTNLGDFAVGARVNLERALPAGRPMGGHYVQGHVDGTAQIRAIRRGDGAYNLEFDAPPALLRHIVEKGFVTIDGVSLTVVSREQWGFSVTLVPHTLAVVTLGSAPVGARVNIEVDVMAKYVEQALGARFADLEARLDAMATRLDAIAGSRRG